MAQGQRWLLLIHAFDNREKFMAARIVEVFADVKKLDHLTLMLSEIHTTNINRGVTNTDKEATDSWDLLTHICPRFSNSPPYHTLRVMSFVPMIG